MWSMAQGRSVSETQLPFDSGGSPLSLRVPARYGPQGLPLRPPRRPRAAALSASFAPGGVGPRLRVTRQIRTPLDLSIYCPRSVYTCSSRGREAPARYAESERRRFSTARGRRLAWPWCTTRPLDPCRLKRSRIQGVFYPELST